MPIDKDFDVEKFVEKCPVNLSGADFYALTNRARQHALKRLIEHCEEIKIGDYDANEECFLNEEDFNYSLVDFQPTLNEAAFLEYEKYFQKYSSGNKK